MDPEFLELTAAHEWGGFTPSQWQEASVVDRAKILAWHWLKSRLESFLREQAEEKAGTGKPGVTDLKTKLAEMWGKR